MNRQVCRYLTNAATMCLFLTIIVTDARATLRTWSYIGRVFVADSPLNSYFTSSTTVEGEFTFDDSTVDSEPSQTFGDYRRPFVSAAVSFSNGYSATLDTSQTANGGIFAVNDGFRGGDLYTVSIPLKGPNVSGLPVQSLFFWFNPSHGFMLSSDALLTSPAALAGASEQFGSLFFGAVPQRVRFDFILDPNSIPEPSTTALVGTIAAALLVRRRCSLTRSTDCYAIFSRSQASW